MALAQGSGAGLGQLELEAEERGKVRAEPQPLLGAQLSVDAALDYVDQAGFAYSPYQDGRPLCRTWKHGVHIHVPKLYLDITRCKYVREAFIADLAHHTHDWKAMLGETLGAERWACIVDEQVYSKNKNGGGLRLIGAPKACRCPERHVAKVVCRFNCHANLQHVIDHAARHRAARLAELARQLPNWRTLALKQKAVYRILNMWNYDLTRKCLIAEAWCPVSSYEAAQAAVRRGANRSGAQVPSIVNVIDTDEKPPTYFRQNKFTAGFQALVDTYGVPRYGEINPGAFAVILFPFLFAIMFGDVGHGALLDRVSFGDHPVVDARLEGL